MRWAYGYAQYGYTQSRTFISTTAPGWWRVVNAAPPLAGYRHSVFTVTARRSVHGGRALPGMSTPRWGRVPAMFPAKVPAAENLDSAAPNVNNPLVLLA